jgi:hypothetical protein
MRQTFCEREIVEFLDQFPRRALLVVVKKDIEAISRTRTIEVRACHVHLPDRPLLSNGYRKIVGGLAVGGVEIPELK